MMKIFKAMVVTIMMVAMLALSGCQYDNRHGECVGLMQEDLKVQDMSYNYSVRNIVLAVVFSQTIFVPIIVALTALQCPTGPKQTESK